MTEPSLEENEIPLASEQHDVDEDSSSSHDEEGPNWELLSESLSESALAALKGHLSAPEKSHAEGAVTSNISTKDEIPKEATAAETRDRPNISNKLELPKSNTEYSKKEYWDERFATEEEYEWLVSYRDVANQLRPYLSSPQTRILVVGCGNSSFSADLYDDGFPHVINIDYSETVISTMRERHSILRPSMEWLVMDMTDMSELEDDSFDVVIDKAAMDALMSNEKDVWNPDTAVISACRSMCRHISRILHPGGYHIHISFAQPHFRKKYLLGLHPNPHDDKNDEDNGTTNKTTTTILNGKEHTSEFQWNLCVETIGGDNSDGCFHHFLYIMQKDS